MWVSAAKIHHRGKLPAGRGCWVLMQKVSASPELHIIQFKHKIDVFYRLLVHFFPLCGVHLAPVQVLEDAEPGAHGGADQQKRTCLPDQFAGLFSALMAAKIPRHS